MARWFTITLYGIEDGDNSQYNMNVHMYMLHVATLAPIEAWYRMTGPITEL